MNPRIVVDASVAVKWLIAEEHSGQAEALRRREMIAPSLLPIECGNALRRRARSGDIPAHSVAGKVRALRLAPVASCQPSDIWKPRSRSLLNCAIRSMIVFIWRLRWAKECS